MWSKREVVDYALQRRASLDRLQRVPRALWDFDAHPLLIRSAMHHGEESGEACPVCAHEPLLRLNYTFGEQLGQFSGRIKSSDELADMQDEFGEFRVVVVEVCTECEWNHMILAYMLGDGVARKPPRRRRTVEDIYG
ncbi:MAG: DUF5318 domain-containing protein [Propionibacterium sp.]|nr:DUF5318 domain-containing protein [Propionibacterium sp.]